MDGPDKFGCERSGRAAGLAAGHLVTDVVLGGEYL